MKKLLLFLTLLIVGMSANAQFSPSNNLNYIKLLKNPPIGTKSDSVMVFNGTDKFVKMIPKSEVTEGKEDVTNRTSVISGYSETLYPNEKATHDGLDAKLNISDLPSNLTLYATNVPSGVSTYTKWVSTLNDPDYNTTAVNISTGAISGTAQLISGLSSIGGVITGNPGIINVTTVGNIRRTAGTGTAKFYFELYKRTAAGVETLLGVSDFTLPVDFNTYSEFSATAVWNDGVFTETDRMVIKFYGSRIAGGGDPTFDFQFGGLTPVRTIVPVPFRVVASEYELKANKQNSLAADGTNTKYPTVTAVNTGLKDKVDISNSNGITYNNYKEFIVPQNMPDGWIKIATLSSTINQTYFRIKTSYDNNQTDDNLWVLSAGYSTRCYATATLSAYNDTNLLALRTTEINNGASVEIWIKVRGSVEAGIIQVYSSRDIPVLTLRTLPILFLGANAVALDLSLYKRENNSLIVSKGIDVQGGGLTATSTITSGTTTLGNTPPTENNHLTRKDWVDAALALKANLASPTFTGVPLAPTATAGTNTTQIATTAFVTGSYVTLGSSQTITGQKTFTTQTQFNGGASGVTSSSTPGFTAGNSTSGNAIQAFNSSSGNGLYIFNDLTGSGVLVNGRPSASGFNYVGQNNGANTFTVDKLGATTATSFINSTAPATNALLANGTTVALGSNAYTSTAYLPINDGSRVNLDYNTKLTSGFYNSGGVNTNTPSGQIYSQLIVAKGLDTGLQIAGGFTSDNLHFRGWIDAGASFTPWRKIWHDGNFNPANYLPLTGATFSIYANDAAADADATLLSGQFYKLTGSRVVYQKP